MVWETLFLEEVLLLGGGECPFVGEVVKAVEFEGEIVVEVVVEVTVVVSVRRGLS